MTLVDVIFTNSMHHVYTEKKWKKNFNIYKKNPIFTKNVLNRPDEGNVIDSISIKRRMTLID
jgi:hypothetical protein